MDEIGAAIAAAVAPEARNVGVRVQLPTGRMAIVQVPQDLDAVEALALCGYIATGLPRELAKAGRPRPRLLVPGGPIVGR